MRVNSHMETKKDMEEALKHLWERPWPKYAEVDRTSVYARIWELIDEHRRPSP